MRLHFQEVGARDVERLAEWLPAHSWPYHRLQRVDAHWVREHAAAGYFFGSGVRSIWAFVDSTPVGIIRAFDLQDVTPLIDLRISETERGGGIGTELLRWTTQLLFEAAPETGEPRSREQPDELLEFAVGNACSGVGVLRYHADAGTLAGRHRYGMVS
ncbi:MAG TPA: GNAT family N-acetyltransferase [Polyangiaceae bacterium]|jgi:RimJ/RimL family protein N-acetyltransferase|nr:GNAT family N-acetyltransferase [Polyangiaceae bacterium]